MLTLILFILLLTILVPIFFGNAARRKWTGTFLGAFLFAALSTTSLILAILFFFLLSH